MTYARLLLTGLLALSAPGLFAAATPTAPLQQARRQLRDFYCGSSDAFALRDTNEQPPAPDQALRQAQAIQPDGSWADIDYQSKARSGWPPSVHYMRMAAMATAAGWSTTTPSERAALIAATHRAFTFWIAHDFQCPNWWYNQIGTPKMLGLCALLLGDELTVAERDYVTGPVLLRSKIALTGQNRVWLAGNTLMRGLLLHDEALIKEAANTIWSEVRVSTDEGIQPDFSFHQHGPQQQFGNYGMAFAVEVCRWGVFLRDTPWQMPPAQLTIFRRYLLDGQNWVAWRGTMDISACGRQFMPHSPRAKASNIAMVMKLAALFDPAEAPAYRAFVARNQPGADNDLVGLRVFWRSDYAVHRRPGFAATLKLSSHRVIGAELVNSENLSGYHTADGALYLYATGDEYDDIFPVWDWRKLPGVTCAQTPPPAFKTSAVPVDFAGGVTDGTRGCAAIDYRRDGVQARKAWFFGDDVVVCLGAGITGREPAGIATTLEQSLLHGPVRTFDAAGSENLAAPGRHLTSTDLGAVEHVGWRYTLLSPGTLHLDTGPVTGNWHRVFSNPESPVADVTKDVFLLWLDHGTSPDRDTYAYAISPSTAQPQFTVLANTPELQAVQLGDTQVAVIFWSPGAITLPDHRRLAVNQPCLVLTDARRSIVTDPTQTLRELHLTLDGRVSTVALHPGASAEIHSAK